MRYALALLLICLAASPASAQETLFAADPAVRARLAPQQAGVLGHLERLDAFVAADLGAAEPAALQADAAVRVVLPGGGPVDLRPDRVEAHGAGGLTWSGRGAARGTLGTFVVHDGLVVGTVRHGGRLFTLRPLGNGLSALVELDEAAFVDHPEDWDAVEAEAAHRHPQRRGAGTQTEVDPDTMLPAAPVITLLVPYTAAAAAAVGGVSAVEALIQLAEEETNQSYRNSRVAASVEVVHTYQVADAEAANDLGADVGRLSNPTDGKWDDVHALRDARDADAVILITGNVYGGYCGVASTIYADESEAFAIAAHHCATGYYTFGHELGHLQGARHNPEADGSTTPFAYGHGRYDADGGWRTVMSYNCPTGCTRLPYWSNPDVDYEGAATGDESTRHNARVLSETAAEVAAFRGPTAGGAASVVATPTGTAVISRDGGLVSFDLTFSNASGGTFIGEAWVMATLPNGTPYGPVFGPTALTLTAGTSTTESLTARVPAGAPAGDYALTAYVGASYPGAFGSSSSFGFTKSAGRPAAGAADLTWVVENTTRGTSSTLTMPSPFTKAASFELSAYPSPLVGRGTVAFSLGAPADVRVAVYDVTGRRVAVLAEGAFDAGRHTSALDASALPSGVYLVRLRAEGTGGLQTLTRRVTVVR